ncbi:MAG: M20/M25/M40 family metallo-hydrolase [Armatimonadaceae bacterium]
MNEHDTTPPPALPSPRELLAHLIAEPGPPGQEDVIRRAVAEYLEVLKLPYRTDVKGNLLTWLGDSCPNNPEIVVMAHLDEIALLVREIDFEGQLRVSPLGGAHPWKWGEGPVEALGNEPVPGVLSFGSIHTTAPQAVAPQVRDGRPLTWDMARIFTGLTPEALHRKGIGIGSRVVLARQRRTLWQIGGNRIASYFLDDRADLVSWLLALQYLKQDPSLAAERILFVATVSEEVGGEGALFLLQEYRPPVCIALEIGPSTPDAPFPIDACPTLWVTDSFSTMTPQDIRLVQEAADETGVGLHRQAVTRGGSDASCAASRGLCARPITLAFAAENSHGFEIMHEDAPQHLAILANRVIKKLLQAGNTGLE